MACPEGPFCARPSLNSLVHPFAIPLQSSLLIRRNRATCNLQQHHHTPIHTASSTPPGAPASPRAPHAPAPGSAAAAPHLTLHPFMQHQQNQQHKPSPLQQHEQPHAATGPTAAAAAAAAPSGPTRTGNGTSGFPSSSSADSLLPPGPSIGGPPTATPSSHDLHPSFDPHAPSSLLPAHASLLPPSASKHTQPSTPYPTEPSAPPASSDLTPAPAACPRPAPGAPPDPTCNTCVQSSPEPLFVALTWLTRPSCALVVSKPSPRVRPTMLAVLRWLHGHGVCTYVEPSAVKELVPQLRMGGKGGGTGGGGGGGGEGGAGESGEWLDAHHGTVDLEQCWDEGLEDMPGCKTGGGGARFLGFKFRAKRVWVLVVARGRSAGAELL